LNRSAPGQCALGQPRWFIPVPVAHHTALAAALLDVSELGGPS